LFLPILQKFGMAPIWRKFVVSPSGASIFFNFDDVRADGLVAKQSPTTSRHLQQLPLPENFCFFNKVSIAGYTSTMRPGNTKFSLLILLILLVSINGLCQVNENNENIKLIKWASEDCDHTYDPNRLVTRITRMETKDGVTKITVNFPENCSVPIEPEINFRKNKLTLLPY